MATTFEQFVRFATDASGLERTFRLLQALTQVLIFVAPARNLAYFLLGLFSSVDPEKVLVLSPFVLGNLRTRFALGRRFFRVFRFLESFNAAWAAYNTSPSASGGRSLESWLDVSSRSFNGMYLLLETLTFPEALGVEGLSVWGSEIGGTLNVEGQRFWFFALVCGVGAGLVRLARTTRVGDEGKKTTQREGGEKRGADGDEDLQDSARLQEQLEREQERNSRVLRRLVADVLDLAVPGAVVGWVPASPGTVGLVMLASTWLTALEAWERCGKELVAVKAK